MAVLAVDAGGTNLKLGIVEESGELLLERIVPAQPTPTAEGYLEQVAAAADQLIADWGGQPTALAMAMPGPLDSDTGIVFAAPNLGPWKNAPVRAWLAARYPWPVTLLNDAEAAALGEWWLGAGQGARCLVIYTLGTGVGGGLIIDGRLWRGVGGAAGELGHATIDPNGPLCGCGNQGCLEAYAGKHGIVRDARQRLAATLPEFEATYGKLEPASVARAAAAGDARCRAVFEQVGTALGVAMATIVAILAPDRIVVAGGVAGAYDLFESAMRKAIAAHSFESAREHLEIRRGTLRQRAGVLGAARAHYGDGPQLSS